MGAGDGLRKVGASAVRSSQTSERHVDTSGLSWPGTLHGAPVVLRSVSFRTPAATCGGAGALWLEAASLSSGHYEHQVLSPLRLRPYTSGPGAQFSRLIEVDGVLVGDAQNHRGRHYGDSGRGCVQCIYLETCYVYKAMMRTHRCGLIAVLYVHALLPCFLKGLKLCPSLNMW